MQLVKYNVRFLILLIVCLCAGACTTPGKLKPTDLRKFSSDGCSHYPDGTPSAPKKWESCCVSHDRDYWAGGIRAARKYSDVLLKQCVARSSGSKFRAYTMWLGVRFAGVPWLPSSFRWAYGWPYYRGYKPITPEEQLQIDQKGSL